MRLTSESKKLWNLCNEITNKSADGYYVKIQHVLQTVLPQKLQFAKPNLYKDYYDYIGLFCKQGGIVEGAPSLVQKNVSSPGVIFTLEPDGEVEILTSFEKIISSPFNPCGFKFSQKSLPNLNIRQMIELLAGVLYKQGMFGFFTLDLLSFPDPYRDDLSKSENLFWANGLTTHFNDIFSNYTLSSVMTGKFESNLDKSILVLPAVYHKSLSSIHYKSFFHMTRLESLYFDVASKTGLMFVLADSLQSGILGLIAFEGSNEAVYSTLMKALNFLRKQGGDVREKYWTLTKNERLDLPDVGDVFGKVKVDIKAILDQKNKQKPLML